MTSFLSSESTSAPDENAMKAELLFTGFICEHNLPISTADQAGKLLNAMFPDSKIVKKYSCGRTKTTNVSSGAVAKESVSNLKLTLFSSACTSGLVLLLMVAVMKMTSFYPCLSGTLHQIVLLQHLYWTCLILTRSLIQR